MSADSLTDLERHDEKLRKITDGEKMARAVGFVEYIARYNDDVPEWLRTAAREIMADMPEHLKGEK